MFLIREIKVIIGFLIIQYPDTQFGFWMRSLYWRYVHKTIGKNTVIHRGAKIGLKGMVEIGHDCMIDEYVTIAAGESKGIFLGNHIMIAKNAFLRTANHEFNDRSKPMSEQGHRFKVINYMNKEYSIVVEDDVWIAVNAVILTGSHIGKGSIIGAGAVTRGYIPPYSIVVGNPGVIIGQR